MRFRRRLAGVLFGGLVAGAMGCMAAGAQARPDELAWALKYDPKTLDPALTDDQSSEMVRFLTAGVLLRFDRRTQEVAPALAERYEVSADGRVVTLHLRGGLQFSDGSPLTAKDAVWSLQRVLDPATKAPVAEEFGAGVKVEAPDAATVQGAAAEAGGGDSEGVRRGGD